MNKNKTRLTALVVIIALIASIALIISTRQPNKTDNNSSNADMILFYSFSCPHCQNVSDYISENDIKDKYSFTELEISENQNNSTKLIQKAKDCGYDTATLGVPFLWTGETCLMGDTNIIDFFKP
jgi:glutaredoxin-related protein